MCWVTSFQLVGHVGAGESAEVAWQTFVRMWALIFGVPEVVVANPGAGFQGVFMDDIQNNVVCLFPTDARAPWQNGRAERAGEEWKRQFRLAVRKLAPNASDGWCAMRGAMLFGAKPFRSCFSTYATGIRLYATIAGYAALRWSDCSGVLAHRSSTTFPSCRGPPTSSHESMDLHGQLCEVTTSSAGTPLDTA